MEFHVSNFCRQWFVLVKNENKQDYSLCKMGYIEIVECVTISHHKTIQKAYSVSTYIIGKVCSFFRSTLTPCSIVSRNPGDIRMKMNMKKKVVIFSCLVMILIEMVSIVLSTITEPRYQHFS